MNYSEAEQERFWRNVDCLSLEECWNWKKAQDHGYGYYRFRGGVRLAHRIAFALANDVLWSQLDTVRYDCSNKLCCNPMHLFNGTQYENVLDYFFREREGAVPLCVVHDIVRRLNARPRWRSLKIEALSLAEELRSLDFKVYPSTIKGWLRRYRVWALLSGG